MILQLTYFDFFTGVPHSHKSVWQEHRVKLPAKSIQQALKYICDLIECTLDGLWYHLREVREYDKVKSTGRLGEQYKHNRTYTNELLSHYY